MGYWLCFIPKAIETQIEQLRGVISYCVADMRHQSA